MLHADAMAFFTPQGEPPVADPGLAEDLQLAQLTAAPPYLTGPAEILRGVQEFSHTIKSQPGLRLITRSQEMSTVGAGRTGVVLGLQNAPQRVSRESLQLLSEAGMSIVAISYRDADHPLGAGFDSMSRGLTEAGRRFIRDCSGLDLIVDLSHSGHQTARDVLEMIDGEHLPLRVMASHGGCYSIYKDPRNLPDDVLRGIAEHDGIVGVFSLTFSLDSSDDTPGPMLRHLRHALEVCGDRNVAIGSDMAHQTRERDEWQRHIDWMIRTFDADGSLRARWPETPVELNVPDRMERIGRMMAAEGFGGSQTERVLGENLLRFLGEALPSK
jgi:membrane dipeptidase